MDEVVFKVSTYEIKSEPRLLTRRVYKGVFGNVKHPHWLCRLLKVKYDDVPIKWICGEPLMASTIKGD